MHLPFQPEAPRRARFRRSAHSWHGGAPLLQRRGHGWAAAAAPCGWFSQR
ncbi:MAG: hypothetical protein AVDCRST_MAG68-577 [uncultured Gemmatimonadetes bacterium]|uniref:Uncharacterized protein n=1 Tax=uncultured Gemmatimonadota bacterium TaxID=203437 RepID=A0A6J4KCY2_9BACT|nr:MAG: hypothetical protein AVDCRST_MAG68-577 [uncultured Gemmatimonadota bacterium]